MQLFDRGDRPHIRGLDTNLVALFELAVRSADHKGRPFGDILFCLHVGGTDHIFQLAGVFG